VPLPLPHRAAWAAAHPGAETWLISVRDRREVCQFALGVQVHHSRALPGHRVLRVERLSPGPRLEAARCALAVLTAAASGTPRVLRIHVELYSPDAEVRRQVATWLEEHGYRRGARGRCYQHTLLVDLKRSEQQMLAALSGRAQRNIKAIARHPVAVRAIVEHGAASRLDALVREAFARTGGTYQPHDWSAAIELSRAHPDHSRIIGLFRTDREGPDTLLGFAWAQCHGSYAHYAIGASTRPADLRIPLSYALVWELACWARRTGATYLDLGGVTLGRSDAEDPLAGITDFKRSFSDRVVEVGEEWVLEPHPRRARIARALSASGAWLARTR
jgi:peptidoglycan pentaglycine glycine transferase (the first glycine)